MLGTGSFGRVSLARHVASGRVCAIKALSKANVLKNQQVCIAMLPLWRFCQHTGLFEAEQAQICFRLYPTPAIAVNSLYEQQQLCLQAEHLKAERKVLKLMNFPFVVRLLASFQDDDCVYFVMEYSCGGEFFKHLKAKGR